MINVVPLQSVVSPASDSHINNDAWGLTTDELVGGNGIDTSFDCSGAMSWLNPFCGGKDDGSKQQDGNIIPFVPFAKRVGVFMLAMIFIAAALFMLAAPTIAKTAKEVV